MRVLYIEDSASLRRSVQRGLEAAGFLVDVAGDGDAGLHLARQHDHDVIVLDLIAPEPPDDALERLRDHPDAGPPRARAVEEVAAAARRMGDTIAALSTLARASAGQALTAAPVPVDLAARDLDVSLALPATAPLRAEPAALRSALSNLLDNAVTHPPPGGRVAVTLTPHPLSLTIANRPVALDDADVAHLFEPFWRKDAARALRPDGGA